MVHAKQAWGKTSKHIKVMERGKPVDNKPAQETNGREECGVPNKEL